MLACYHQQQLSLMCLKCVSMDGFYSLLTGIQTILQCLSFQCWHALFLWRCIPVIQCAIYFKPHMLLNNGSPQLWRKTSPCRCKLWAEVLQELRALISTFSHHWIRSRFSLSLTRKVKDDGEGEREGENERQQVGKKVQLSHSDTTNHIRLSCHASSVSVWSVRIAKVVWSHFFLYSDLDHIGFVYIAGLDSKLGNFIPDILIAFLCQQTWHKPRPILCLH